MVDETLSLDGRTDETRWGNLHTFQGAGALFVLAGGCERAGDQMKQDGATIHAFTSSRPRQNQFLMRLDIHMQALHLVGFCHPCVSHPAGRDEQSPPTYVSTYICKPPIPPRLGRPIVHIQQAETKTISHAPRHTYASYPSRLALVAPCVHIQQAETNTVPPLRLDIHMQALHLVGFCRPVLILQRVPCVFTNPNNPPYPPSRHGDLKSPRPLQPPLVPHRRPLWPRSGTAFPSCPRGARCTCTQTPTQDLCA